MATTTHGGGTLPSHLTPAERATVLGFIYDTIGLDAAEEGFSEAESVRHIAHVYDGGWDAFVTDYLDPLDPEYLTPDTEGDCCPRCANPQHRDLFDRLGIGHEYYCPKAVTR